MTDDELKALKELRLDPPSDEARTRALAASLGAFDAMQNENTSPAAQGVRTGGRLKAITNALRGLFTMDMRIPVGTIAVGLLLLPLGYQLYTSTMLSPPVVTNPVEFKDLEILEQTVVPLEQRGRTEAPVDATELVVPNIEDEAGSDIQLVIPVDPMASRQVQTVAVNPDGSLASGGSPEVSPDSAVVSDSFPMSAAEPMAQNGVLTRQAEAVAPMAPPAPMPSVVDGEADMAVPLGGVAAMQESESLIMALPPGGDEFSDFEESPLHVVADEPVSTFSIDVDTASYSYVRSMLEDGYLPPPDAVRVEELINYFPYDYAGPEDEATPFETSVAIYPTPWNAGTQLLHIGIRGYEPPATVDPASNLTFLIDTSGSMDEPDKLPLLKRAFALLVNQLTDNDTVSIVVYAGSAGVVLPPTGAEDKTAILNALDNLWAGGSTAGAEGISLAYALNEQNMVEGGINRVILATDGDFNVGISDPNELTDFISRQRDSGISLSVIGFGQGNYGDDTMQALAQNGNGNAAYISDFREAQKVLVEEMGGTLMTIASDVKIQIEFNPAVVAEYRLIGYETRALAREDFNNDQVDAGEIGAGHTVTAIYEITPVGSDAALVDPLRYETAPEANAESGEVDEYGFLKLRYKLPGEDESTLIEIPVGADLVADSVSELSDDMRFAAAVAAFGQKLRGSDYIDMEWSEIRSLAQNARGEDEGGYRTEFVQLVRDAELLD